MFSPSLASRADTVPATAESLVISVHADERGAREAARWADQVHSADAALGTDSRLEARVAAARRVLVLDPGMLAARRGFGVRATSQERLALVARLAGRAERVTWAATAAQASQWVRDAAA
jgi:hypothetical protein